MGRYRCIARISPGSAARQVKSQLFDDLLQADGLAQMVGHGGRQATFDVFAKDIGGHGGSGGPDAQRADAAGDRRFSAPPWRLNSSLAGEGLQLCT